MQMVADHVRWCAGEDESALLVWTADRAAAGAERHLAPVVAVGRLADGRLAVDVLRPAEAPLSSALDVLGTTSVGVAVTLTVPLLELAVAERCGAVRVGSAGLDDVLVDDAGAVVLCDRPPGTDGVRRSDETGARILLLAARVVWERTDAREPSRALVDAGIAEALVGDVDAVRALLSCVRAAAAPRPVRWAPPPRDFLLGDPEPAAPTGSVVLLAVRDLVDRGVPLGGARRLPLRRALVGVVVAAGVVAAAVFALG